MFPGVPSVGAMGPPLGSDLPNWLCVDDHHHCCGETPLCCQVQSYIYKPWHMWKMIFFHFSSRLMLLLVRSHRMCRTAPKAFI